MKKREKLYPLVLASTALFLFLIVSSSTVLAANNGNILAFQGNYEDAIKAYDKAIENNSQGSDAWYYKGAVLAFQGNFKEAIKAFDKATEIDPQFASAWYSKGLCLMNLGNYEDFEEAIKAFDKAIEIVPQNEDAWINKGLCLVYLGNYEEAIKAFDKAIELDHRDPDSWYNKGLCLAHLEKCGVIVISQKCNALLRRLRKTSFSKVALTKIRFFSFLESSLVKK